MAEPIQWEYRVLSVGTFWSEPKDEDLESALDQLGEDGWEVINLITHYATNKVRVVAKRPLAQASRRPQRWPG